MGLIIDNFAGGGGASTGIELALGRKVDIAINHSSDAIALHKTNHPLTKHYQEDVWAIDPVKVCNGKSVDLAWFSPDCTHFSKAKGSKPVSKKIRGLAWVSLRWAALVRPRVIILENVEEFKTWGPIRRGRPIKSRKGETFKKFIEQYKKLGYDVEFKELIAADYGAPTKRKRFFMIARFDNLPIKWPKPMFAPLDKAKQLKLPPYRSAESIIDWSIECKSIFDRKKPLSEATMKRIARGLKKFVFDEINPFIVQIGQTGFTKDRSSSIREPIKTIVSKNEFCLVDPFLIPIGYGENKGQKPRVHDIKQPLPTIVSSNKHHLITPYLVDYHFNNAVKSIEKPYPTITTIRGHYLLAPYLMVNTTGHSATNLRNPISTITTGNHEYLVAPFISQYFKGNSGCSLKTPLPTVTTIDHSALVTAFLIKYYGNGDNTESLKDPLATVVSKDRFGLVKIKNANYKIVDIGMRMLVPRELFNAQGFPPDYKIERDYQGKKYSVAKQIASCGNSVPPPFSEALVRANLPELCVGKKIESMKYLYTYSEQLSLLESQGIA